VLKRMPAFRRAFAYFTPLLQGAGAVSQDECSC